MNIINFPSCKSCKGLLWVCEVHNDQPWNEVCCGGAGEPCKECNNDETDIKDLRGFKSIQRIEWSEE